MFREVTLLCSEFDQNRKLRVRNVFSVPTVVPRSTTRIILAARVR